MQDEFPYRSRFSLISFLTKNETVKKGEDSSALDLSHINELEKQPVGLITQSRVALPNPQPPSLHRSFLVLCSSSPSYDRISNGIGSVDVDMSWCLINMTSTLSTRASRGPM